MNKNRLEAFSDGVLAIIITIMVLEIKVPHGHTLQDLVPLAPTFFSYFVSFLFVGIYWGNHHHLFSVVKSVNARMMLANLHLLFWLSLVPWATGWMGENNFSPVNVATYSAVMCLCGIAYTILQLVIEKSTPMTPQIKIAMTRQTYKSYISAVIFVVAFATAFIHPIIPGFMFLSITILWLVPDRNIEKAFHDK